MSFVALDWLVLAAFMLALVGIVVWVAMQHEEDTEDYFLAGRNATWLAIGASIFASNIGSEHLVGLASAGAQYGLAMAHWEFQSWIILMLAWIFVPFYWRTKIFTTPEFLERRYTPQTRTFFSFISLVSYVLTKVSVTVYAGGLAIQEIFGIDTMFGIDFFWIAAISLVVITGLYTVIGGMKAVLWTSVLQTPVLLLGSCIILFVGLTKLGAGAGLLEGWAVMSEITGPNMHLFRPIDDPMFPWPAVIGGSIIIGTWYWCTDQYIVQRVLSGRDMTQARRGAIFGGYLKITPVFIFMVPGMIAFALAEKGMLDLSGGSNTAFPVMVRELLPAGIKGVVLGGAIAALMSSLASLFNSSATLFTVDFYERLRPNRSQKHYLKVGRIATSVVVVLGIAWVPVIPLLGESLYEALQKVQALIAPSIVAVFFLGIFSNRITPSAGFWGLVLGFAAGMFYLVLDLFPGIAASNGFFAWIQAMNWLYYCCMLLIFSIAVMVVVSVFSQPKSDEELSGLTYKGVTPEQAAEVRESWSTWDVVNTTIILGIIVLCYVAFF
ncbi:sodium:solute symporter [Pseudomonadota bacterium]